MGITEETRRLARARKDDLKGLTDAQVVALVGAWVNTYDDLAGEYERLAYEIANRASVDGATPHQLRQMEQVRQAQVLGRDRVAGLAEYADSTIAADVDRVVRSAPPQMRSMLDSQAPPGVGISFNEVPEDALDAIVARSTTRISARTMPLPADTEAALGRALSVGISAGSNPNDVARRLTNDLEGAFMGGLPRATTIARTEMLDAHRAADLLTAEANSDLIHANIWYAEFDGCLACVVNHGTEFPPEEFGPEGHPNCRCTFITRLKSWSELGFTGMEQFEDEPIQTGEEYIQSLTPDSQRELMGAARYEKWAAGETTLQDMVVRHENPDWRASYQVRPVKDL